MREAKESLLETLEKKMSLIHRLKVLTDSVTLGEGSKEVGGKLNQYMSEVQDQFPQTAKKEMEREEWKKIVNEGEKRTDLLMNKGALTEEEQLELNTRLEDNGLFRKKLRILENDPDLTFLMNLRAVTESLKSKFSFIANHCGTKEDAIERLDEVLKTPLPAGSIQKLTIKPFDVTAVLKSEHFKELNRRNKNSGAFHVSGSPFSVIRENKNPLITELSARHEGIHNLFEGISKVPPYPSEKIKKLLPNSIRRLTLIKETRAPESILKNEKEIITQSLPHIFTDDLHEEMVADIDKVEAGFPFTTAASEVKRMEDYIDSYVKDISDEEARSLCLKMKENIRKKFERSSGIMETSLSIADEKTDKSQEVHGLFAMLKPSKFHHVKTYLGTLLGEETVKGFFALHEISSRKMISPLLLEAVHAIREKLNEEQRTDLLLELSKAKDIQGIETLEEARVFIQKARELLPHHVLKHFFSKFEKELKENFFTNLLNQDIKKDFHSLPEVMKTLNEKEKDLFKKALENYFALGFAHERIEEGNMLTSESLSSYGFWQTLKDLNLQRIVQKGLKKFEKNTQNENTPT